MLSARFGPQNKSILSLSNSQIGHLEDVKTKINCKDYRLVSSFCVCEDKEDNHKIISKVDRYGINLNTKFCFICGTLRIDPYLDSKSLSDFYKNHYQHLYRRYEVIDDYFKSQELYAIELETLLESKNIKFKSIFEIGCGAGGALNYFLKNNYIVGGSEYSGELLNFINNSKLKNFVVSPENVKRYDYDIIFLNHVFEHLDNPKSFLLDIIKKMAPNSKIVLTVPDYSRIDLFRYPGGNLMNYIHIAHKFNFSYLSFKKLSNQLNLNLEHLLVNKKKSEFTIILSFEKNSNKNNINYQDANNLYKYLIQTEKKFKYLLTYGQLINLHYIFLRKIYVSLPRNIQSLLKKIRNYFK